MIKQSIVKYSTPKGSYAYKKPTQLSVFDPVGVVHLHQNSLFIKIKFHRNGNRQSDIKKTLKKVSKVYDKTIQSKEFDPEGVTCLQKTNRIVSIRPCRGRTFTSKFTFYKNLIPSELK
jgi:hypothetical protein